VGKTTGLRRLYAGYDALRTAPSRDRDEALQRTAVDEYRAKFFAALDDDLNTSGAVSVLFTMAAAANALIAQGAASHAAAFMHEAMAVLGISPNERAKVVERSVTTTITASTTTSAVAYRITRQGAEHLREDAIERLRLLVGEIVPLGALSGHATVDAVVEARLRAKSEKDFALADRLRVALADAGVTLADSKEGTSWSVGV